jgi:hypothetical protein
MKRKNIIYGIIGLVIGLAIGAGALGFVAHYQYEKRGELSFYLDAILKFIDNAPECLAAIEKMELN